VKELSKLGRGESVRRELPHLIAVAQDFERKAETATHTHSPEQADRVAGGAHVPSG